jgi:cell division transport system ATP-binding protein
MRYSAGPEILRDVSFELKQGSFTFLTGLSGAGKTTLLKLICLAEPPSRGLITLFGEDLATARRRDLPALRRRIGVVFQDFRLLSHLSVYDNVALPLRLAGKRDQDYVRDVRELLSWVGLGERMTARPATISGGEQQRVAIARALAHGPKVLLADEPTGNLDDATGESIRELLFEMNAQSGATLVLVTHDPDFAARCDRVLGLHEGRLRELKVAAKAAMQDAVPA